MRTIYIWILEISVAVQSTARISLFLAWNRQTSQTTMDELLPLGEMVTVRMDVLRRLLRAT